MSYPRVRSRWSSGGLGLTCGAVVIGLGASASGQPVNDACSAAVNIGLGTTTASTLNSSNDGSASCGAAATSPDIWYRFVAAQAGLITITTCSANTVYDSVISVHTGCPGTGASEIACNDDNCSIAVIPSTLSFTAGAGVPYLIRVAGWNGETGSFEMTLSPPPEPTVGPDMTLREINSVTNWGAIDGVRAYSIGSTTCNLGDTNLQWQGNTNQHAVMGMHVYRLHGGALEQIGLSWCKNATNAGAGSGCGLACNGQGGTVLGAGCMDVYGATGNGMHLHLGPRSDVNAFTGFFNFPFPIGESSGDAIYKRIQVREADLNAQTFAGAIYFVEGVWATPDDAAAGNALNNASHRRVTLGPAPALDLNLAGPTRVEVAAIYAWRENGSGVGVTDNAVQIVNADVPSEGRFVVGARAYDNGNGTWRYEYAVFNLNSHRSGGSFSVPIPTGAAITGVGFHDVPYHSGEPFDNTDWSTAIGSNAVTWWSPQPFSQNPDSNALRWGTMYNFRFTANVAPALGEVTLGLFRPGAPASITAAVATPGGAAPCPADFNGSGGVSVQDIFDFLAAYFNNDLRADFNGVGGISVQDIFDFLAVYFAGC